MCEQNGLAVEADMRTQLLAGTSLQPLTATPRLFLNTRTVLSHV